MVYKITFLGKVYHAIHGIAGVSGEKQTSKKFYHKNVNVCALCAKAKVVTNWGWLKTLKL